MFIFPVQLTTSRIGNLTRLIHTLLYVMTIHTYIHSLKKKTVMLQKYAEKAKSPKKEKRKKERKTRKGRRELLGNCVWLSVRISKNEKRSKGRGNREGVGESQ